MTTPNDIHQVSSELDQRLFELSSQDINKGIKRKFADDPERAGKYSFELGDLLFDLSKTHISHALIETYVELAHSIDFENSKERLFGGEKINNTEQRSVLHTLLRDSNNQNIELVDPNINKEARDAEIQFSEKRDDIVTRLSRRNIPIKNIIHIGIGGSSLGTQLLFEALKEHKEAINIHFITNIDAHQLVSVISQCEPQSTLLIGVSKTFTTAETLKNISSIGTWLSDNGLSDWEDNLIAVTAAPENALNFGVRPNNIVAFPEWVGGRYSVWSSVSLSAAIILGDQKFKEFLQGASKVDQHFYTQPLEKNICFLSAALDHYYCNYMESQSRAIFAYDFRLRSLVDYLQQLETESNGKDRQKTGLPVTQKTSPVVWGGVGTDVQHSVFQMLHQGTSLIPAEFILVAKPDHSLNNHHSELLANGIAQTAALLSGQTIEEVKKLHSQESLSDETLYAKVFSGNRPSTTILLKSLSPMNLGALLAYYEHRTFCGGVLNNINSFDQMGVELGKRLATEVHSLLTNIKEPNENHIDKSSLNLIRKVRNIET